MFVKGMVMRLLILMVLIYTYIRLASSNIAPIDSESVKVRIDSVSTRCKYTFVPDTIWAYHTKYGPTLYSTSNNHKVGDSVLINLVTKDTYE